MNLTINSTVQNSLNNISLFVDKSGSNHTFSTTIDMENIGGMEFLMKYIHIYMPYNVLTFVGILFGFLGNTLIIGSILMSKELRTNSTCLLCLNLAIADFSITCFVNGFTIVGIMAGKRFFDQNPGLCDLVGSICLVSCGTALLTMGFLALNR